MKKRLILILIVFGCFSFIISCGPQKYVYKDDPSFSFTVPPRQAPDKLRSKDEVVRYGSTENSYKIPTYAVTIVDKPSGFTLADAGQFAIDDLKKIYPTATRWKVLSSKKVKLSDGSDAQAITLKWKWTDQVTLLKSADVVAIKGDKVIHFNSITIFAGGTSMDDLMAVVMSLQLK